MTIKTLPYQYSGNISWGFLPFIRSILHFKPNHDLHKLNITKLQIVYLFWKELTFIFEQFSSFFILNFTKLFDLHTAFQVYTHYIKQDTTIKRLLEFSWQTSNWLYTFSNSCGHWTLSYSSKTGNVTSLNDIYLVNKVCFLLVRVLSISQARGILQLI